MKKPTFEYTYPTKAAREKADKKVEYLPLEASMGEHIRVWESEYLERGGVIR